MFQRTNVDLEIVVTTCTRGLEHYFRFELKTANRKIKLRKKKIEGEPFDDVEALRHRILATVEQVAEDRLTGPEVVERLEKIGNDLYDEVFPVDLQDEFWRHRAHIKTLLVSSDEPWIPWEFVKPYRDSDEMGFLCRSCVMGRRLIGAKIEREAETSFLDRLLGSLTVPMRDLHVSSAAVVAVGQSYDQSFVDLSATERDLSTLRDLLGKKRLPLEERSNATYENFKELLEKKSFGLFHFAGHGDAGIDTDQSQLHLADRPVSARFLAGPIKNKLRRERPLVFLNACRVARSGRSLTRLDGWAQRWVADCGAGGFIAPLLSVRDDRAAEFALKFYEKIDDGWSMGEAVRGARDALFEQEPRDPTWLAYSFFGHPDAKVIFGKRSRVEETLEGLLDSRKIAALVTFIIALGSLIFHFYVPEPTTVAIRGPTKEESWRVAAVAELLHASLNASRGVRSIDRRHLVELEEALAPKLLSDRQMVEALRETLGAESMVKLAYSESGQQAELQLCFASTDVGEIDWERVEKVQGPVNDLPALVREASEHLAEALGFDPFDVAKVPEVVAALPTETAVAKPYVLGLEAYRRSDLLEAWIHFEDARRSGAHPQVSLARARIRNDMGQTAAAARELVAAKSLPGRQRLVVEAELALAQGRFQEAIGVFQQIYEEDSLDPAACLRLVESLRRAERGEDALARARECGIQLSPLDRSTLSVIKAWTRTDHEEAEQEQTSTAAVSMTMNSSGDSENWTSALAASRLRLNEEVLQRSRATEGFGEDLEDILENYAPERMLARDCLRTSAFLAEKESELAPTLLQRCLPHLDEDDDRVLLRWREGELWFDKRDFAKASTLLPAVAGALSDRNAHGLAAEVLIHLGDIDLAKERLAEAWRRYLRAEEEARIAGAEDVFTMVSARWSWILVQADLRDQANRLWDDPDTLTLAPAREHDRMWTDFTTFADKLEKARESLEAETLYHELQTRLEIYDEHSAGLQLQATFLELSQAIKKEEPLATHQETLLNAAEYAAQTGYLGDVRKIRDELSRLGAEPIVGSLVESLDVLVEEEKVDWEARAQQALEAMERWK